MAYAFNRFVKKTPVFGLINNIKLTPPLLSQTFPIDDAIDNSISTANFFENTTTQIVNPNPDAINSFHTHIFPALPFGVQLNSLSPSGSDEDGQSDDGEERVIRADSVKKKRKKKMNKHKYKKLRKRLRRKT